MDRLKKKSIGKISRVFNAFLLLYEDWVEKM